MCSVTLIYLFKFKTSKMSFIIAKQKLRCSLRKLKQNIKPFKFFKAKKKIIRSTFYIFLFLDLIKSQELIVDFRNFNKTKQIKN